MKNVLVAVAMAISLFSPGVLPAQEAPDISAVSALISPDPAAQIDAQAKIVDALRTPGPKRGSMIAALKRAALGNEATQAGPRALAMISIAADKGATERQELFAGLYQIYRESAVGGIRDVAIWELVRHSDDALARKYLRAIAQSPVDDSDYSAIIGSINSVKGQGQLDVAKEIAKNGWVKDPLVKAQLKKLLAEKK